MEDEVAREQHPGVGQVHGDVTARVGGAELEQLDDTVTQSAPSKVVVGAATSMPSNVKGPKICWRYAPATPSPGAASINDASIDGGTSSISRALAADATISAPSTSWLP
jgi:hypothetical protein